MSYHIKLVYTMIANWNLILNGLELASSVSKKKITRNKHKRYMNMYVYLQSVTNNVQITILLLGNYNL